MKGFHPGPWFEPSPTLTALRDALDEIIGYLLIGTDNTARKQAEEALRENYALLRTIHLHSIVSVTDQAGRIVDANEGFCKISGYRRVSFHKPFYGRVADNTSAILRT
jgi:PAS domain-containing protein